MSKEEAERHDEMVHEQGGGGVANARRYWGPETTTRIENTLRSVERLFTQPRVW